MGACVSAPLIDPNVSVFASVQETLVSPHCSATAAWCALYELWRIQYLWGRECQNLHEGLAPALVNGLGRWSNTSVAKICCNVLNLMSQNTRFCAAIVASNGVAALLAAMELAVRQQSEDARAVHYCSMCIFHNIAHDDAGRQHTFNAGCHDAIVEVMMDDENFKSYGCQAAGCMALKRVCGSVACPDAVEAIVYAISNGDAWVEFHGFSALSSMNTAGVFDRNDGLCEVFCDALARVVRKRYEHSDIQIAACQTLCNAAVRSGALTDCFADRCSMVVVCWVESYDDRGRRWWLGALALICALHGPFFSEDEMQTAATISLMELRRQPGQDMVDSALGVLSCAAEHSVLASYLVAQGAIELVVPVLARFPQAPSVLYCGCFLLSQLLDAQPSCASALVACGGVETLRAVAQLSRWDVRREACAVLHKLHVLNFIDAVDVAPLYIAAIEQTLQEEAGACPLRNVATFFDVLRFNRVVAQLAGVVGVQRMINALLMHGESEQVTKAACVALTQLCRNCVPARAVMASSCVFEIAFLAVRRHTNVADVVCAGAVLTEAFCQNRNPAVHAIGVVAHVVAAMRRHSRDAAVQKSWHNALRLLLKRCLQTRDAFTRLNGVAAIIDAMRYHSWDVGLQISGMAVLYCLLRRSSPAVKQSFINAGGRDAVAIPEARYRTNVALQRYCARLRAIVLEVV